MELFDILTRVQDFQTKLAKTGDKQAYADLSAAYRKLCRPMMHIGGDTIGTRADVVNDLLEFRKKYGYEDVNVIVTALSGFVARNQF